MVAAAGCIISGELRVAGHARVTIKACCTQIYQM